MSGLGRQSASRRQHGNSTETNRQSTMTRESATARRNAAYDVVSTSRIANVKANWQAKNLTRMVESGESILDFPSARIIEDRGASRYAEHD